MKYAKSMMTILIALILSSCFAQEFVVKKLPVPERPEFEVITQEELQCVSQETFNKIAKRAELRDSHFLKLEEVILSTH